MAGGPLERYRAQVRDGALEDDLAQRLALEKLQLLHSRLADYDRRRGKRVSRGWFGWGREAAKRDADLNGLYMYGGVGRGKSMLMDMFHDAAPVARKRRVHFHAFMQEVHRALDDARAEERDDPIIVVGEDIAANATLLCFDEMQIKDIADAMIVGRLFEVLFREGVVIVATSNRHPDELYKDGLNRHLFLPFIAMLKERLDLHHLDGAEDHRMARIAGRQVYFSPLGPAADAGMDALWRDVAGEGEPGALIIARPGRSWRIPTFRNGVARADFDTLCGAALGPGDYLSLAERVRMLFLDHTPVLTRAQSNEAHRFTTLIDTLYEARTRLAMSAEAAPDALYEDGPGAFEFERTASRLMEMQGENWGAEP